jgi:hypothetical protein
MRLRALSLAEAAVLAAVLLVTVLAGTGLGVAAVRIDGGDDPRSPLGAVYPDPAPPVLNRDRARMLDNRSNTR